jgi:hypothetical protein
MSTRRFFARPAAVAAHVELLRPQPVLAQILRDRLCAPLGQPLIVLGRTRRVRVAGDRDRLERGAACGVDQHVEPVARIRFQRRAVGVEIRIAVERDALRGSRRSDDCGGCRCQLSHDGRRGLRRRRALERQDAHVTRVLLVAERRDLLERLYLLFPADFGCLREAGLLSLEETVAVDAVRLLPVRQADAICIPRRPLRRRARREQGGRAENEK